MTSFIKNRLQFFSVMLMLSLVVFSATAVFAQEEEEFTQGAETTRPADSPDDPVELFNQAQEAHAKGDFETALKLYELAIKANPEFPEAEFQRGSIYLNLGNQEEAEKAFRRAVDLRRDWTLPMAELGALLVRKGDYAEAEDLLNRAIRINSMSFPAYVALTELKLKTNASKDDVKTLLVKLQYLTTKAKIPASIWASRGAIERYLGETDSAKTSIQRALAIDEKNSLALEQNIQLSLIESDTKGAVKNARSLSALYPNSINIKLLLARALYADGNSAEALKTLEAIEDPNPEVTQLKSAIAYDRNDNIESLEKILENDEKNVVVLARLCVLSRTVQPEKALDYCRLASSLEPTQINHAIGFGAALVQLKRYTDAVVLFRRLLESSPENYTIRANLATALFQLQKYEEAKAEYQWITAKQPELAIAYYFLAISHDKTEEYMDAMANYQQFLRLADDSLKLEIEKVNLRLPILQKQIKEGKGKKRRE